MIKRLPQPLKALQILFLMAFGAVFITMILAVVLRSEEIMNPALQAFVVLGVIGFAIGLVLVTDYRGGARALSEALKDYKPMGMDYSKSFLSSPRAARVMGAGYMLIGIWFCVLVFGFGLGH